MELQKIAQRNLFKELVKSDIKAHQSPEYNGYGIDGFGFFQDNLNSLYEKFEIELNDNLTNRSPSLELYLTDIMNSIVEIKKQIHSYQKEEIYDSQKENPEVFKRNSLAYMNYFLNFQLDVIEKTETELSKKLALIKNRELFYAVKEPADSAGASPRTKTVIRLCLVLK